MPGEPEGPGGPGETRRSVLAGTVTWVVLFVLALAAREQLEAAGRGWWIWTALAGAALGLLGSAYLRRRSPDAAETD